MPTISVTKYEIERLLGCTYQPENFSDILFDFGLEIDDIETTGDDITYKIEIPANRYDLLCAEGLANSLRPYLFTVQFEDIKLKPSDYEIINQHTGSRSCIASAIIKNYKFDKTSFDSFISYQEKLCGSLGRNRSLVSLGTHDLDKISWPVTFKSIKKTDLDFVPLNCVESVQNLEEHYKNDKIIFPYCKLLDDNTYSIFEDSNKHVISVPPVINSDRTKISLDTTNILIEVTGTNIHKVKTCLRMILSAFRTDDMYTVRINDDVLDISSKSYVISLQEVYKELNIFMPINKLKTILIKMMYTVEQIDDKSLRVLIPSIRQDVIHKADVIEDIAICYGYNNINMIMPDLNTIGSENRLNKFSDKLRLEMAMLGFIEVYTMVLVSKNDDIFEDNSALVKNYKSLECEVVRNSLFSGLLKSVASNLHCKIPIKIFEIGDVVFLDNDSDVGASNQRFLSCLYVGNKSHLEDVQGPMTTILEKCGVTGFTFERCDMQGKYLKNQSAILKIDNEVFGSIGVCHGDLLTKYKVPYSGSMFELNIEKIFNKFFNH